MSEVLSPRGHGRPLPPRADEARALFEPFLPCSDQELRRAYLRLALRYHPDKWPPAERQAMTELFQAISAVYGKLLDPLGLNSKALARRVKTPAAAAAELGDVDELARLLEERPERANEEDDNHVSPLMLAAKGGSRACVALLLDHGAELCASTPLGWTALLFAALHDQGDMVRFLVGRGLAVSEDDLILTSFTGNPAGLRALLELFNGAPGDIRSEPNGKTLLHLTCEGLIHVTRDNPERYVVCVQQLLAHGVPVEAPCSRRGRTCLQNFVGHSRWNEEAFEDSPSHVEVVRLLCEAGADPRIHDEEGRTALALAASRGLRVVEGILKSFVEDSALKSSL